MQNVSFKIIEVVAYDPKWPQQFLIEAETIEELLGKHCINIEHIGSTSIPGLNAKPEIDILCIVDNLSNSLKLKKHTFVFKGELNVPLRYYFSKNTDHSKVNLHVVEPSHGFINLNLCFRDYLRMHAEDKLAYSKLKEELLKNPKSYEKTATGFSGYNLEKDKFIKSILRKANYCDFTINFCMHYNEWDCYQRLKEYSTGICKEERTSANIKEQPSLLSTDFGNQYHFILYKGTDIVCIAEARLLKNKKIIISLLESVDSSNAQEYKDRLQAFIQQWAKKNKIF